jgi:DNA-binding transcriptional MerR regulator
MDTPSEFFTVSRVCELTGLVPERLDALEATFSDYLDIRRTPAGNRLFTARDVDHLQEIRRLVDDKGLSLNQARSSLFPPEPAQPSPTDTQPIWPQYATPDESGADGPDMPLGTLDEHHVPPLPVEPTVDLLLEAAEGLVQENLRLREAVDSLGERFTDLEKRVSGSFLQRLFGGR